MAYDRPTLSEQIEQMKVAMEVYLGTSEARLRFSYLNTIGTATVGAINGIYGYASYIEDQVFIDTAETENLERHASIWGVERTESIKAEGSNVTFKGSNGSVVPIDTELKRADDTRFVTTEEATIDSTKQVDVAVEAVVAGTDGNTSASISLTLTSPPVGIVSTATVSGVGIVGGADEGTDDELRADLYDRIQTPPQGGSYSDYETWTNEVDNVTRSWVYTHDTIPSTPVGCVHILFMMDDKYVDGVPLTTDLDDAVEYLDTVRPVTATKVTMAAPTISEIDFTIELSPNTDAVKASVTTQLEDLFLRESEPGGTMYLSRIREAISLATGEDYHHLAIPSVDVVSADYTLAKVGTITWV